MHEWPLLIFTITIQTAIGGILMLTLLHRKLAARGEAKMFQSLKLPLLVIAILSIIGLGASFAHLGTPSHAINTIRHLGSSWMSREILFTGLFIASACITAGLAFVQKKVNFILLVVSSIIGLIDVYCMAAIYSHTLVSGWNELHTYTSFYGTVLILGPVMVASMMAQGLREQKGEMAAVSLIKTSFVFVIVGIVIQLIGVALFASNMPDTNMISGTSALSALDGYQSTIVIRWIIEALGLGALGYLMMSSTKKAFSSIAYFALAAVLAAEAMSRYLFYVLGA